MKRTLALVSVCLAFAASAWAQNKPGDDRREVEAARELKRTEAYKLPEATRKMSLDYGAWLRSTVTGFDGPEFANARDNGRRWFRENDLRIWAHYRRPRVAAYVRARGSYTDFNKGDSFDGNDDDLNQGELDRGFLTLDISPLLSDDAPRDIKLHLGRQWYEVGTGLALADTLDGGIMTVAQGNIDFKGFGGITREPDVQDIDLSLPGGKDQSRRAFSGFEAAFQESISGVSPYIFLVIQRDRNRESPNDFVQDYTYDSEYFGVGSRGSVILDNLSYQLEYIHESGRSFASNAPNQLPDEVDANAVTGILEYLVDIRLSPRVFGQYIYASGDKERSQVNSTVNGHFGTTKDQGFLPFGYANTGYVFAPLASNLEVFSGGISLAPINRRDEAKVLEVGGVYYRFRKHRRGAFDRTSGVTAISGISDLTADRYDIDLGYEVDLYANWKINSDLTLSVQAGRFKPGDGFTRDASRDLGAINLTISF